MQSLAEQLMAGPRGRALCLELASRSDMRVFNAVFGLSFEHDRAGWHEVESDPRLGALAVLLSGFTAVADGSVLPALAHTVDSAMYWQEPDDVEFIGGRTEIAAEVGRIAGLVAGSSDAQWWTDPLVAEQFQVRFLPEDHVAAIDVPAETILADAFRRRAVSEPPGYLTAWWSVPPFGLIRTCPAPAEEPSGLVLVEDGWEQTEATVHRVRSQSPRVFEIDSAVAWAQLCKSHPFDATESKSRDWYRTTGLADTRWLMPDWRSVAREYDAVHLQVGAYLAASGTAIEVGPGVHSVIAGWAPGDTYWLTDVVEVEPQGRVFVKDRDDDLWHAAEERT